MKERHFTVKELDSVNIPLLDYIVNELIKSGAPIIKKSLTKTPITDEDVEISGDLSCHSTVNGDVTYIWDWE